MCVSDRQFFWNTLYKRKDFFVEQLSTNIYEWKNLCTRLLKEAFTGSLQRSFWSKPAHLERQLTASCQRSIAKHETDVLFFWRGSSLAIERHKNFVHLFSSELFQSLQFGGREHKIREKRGMVRYAILEPNRLLADNAGELCNRLTSSQAACNIH